MQVGIQSLLNLIDRLFGLPFMLSDKDLIVLPVQAEELFLVMVGHCAHIDVWSLSQIAEPENSSCRLTLDQIGPSGILAILHFEGVILPWLFIVVHLDPRMVFLDRTRRGKV